MAALIGQCGCPIRRVAEVISKVFNPLQDVASIEVKFYSRFGEVRVKGRIFRANNSADLVMAKMERCMVSDESKLIQALNLFLG